MNAYISTHLEGFIQTVTRLCAQPSVSSRGEGMRECAALVAQILTEHGFQVQQYETPGNPVIVAHADGDSDKRLLFYNHYDVQPPEPLELWTTPPFEPSIRDGVFYARGAVDDKGEFVARLAGVLAAKAANGGRLPCGVTFVVEGEEEIGSPTIAAFVEQHRDILHADAAIWEEGGITPDGTPVSILGARGILSVELSVTLLKRDSHSGGAHFIPSAPWRLVRLLNQLKDENELILIPGFYDHARPMSAQDKVWIDASPDLEAIIREDMGIKEFVQGMTGRALDYAVFNPTCNIQGITTGYQGQGTKTIVPATASVKLDFRLVPDQDPNDIFAKLCAYLEQLGCTDVEVRRMGQMFPYKAASGHPFIDLVARAAFETYGKEAFIEPLGGGSTPMYAFAHPLGDIPVIPGPGLHYGMNKTHAPDEHFRLADFEKAVDQISRIVMGFASI